MDLSERIEQLKEKQFLRYAVEQAHGRAGARVMVGEAGVALGLPYEDAIRVADALRARGHVERRGPLDPPDGPAIVLTEAGVAAARRADARAQPVAPRRFQGTAPDLRG